MCSNVVLCTGYLTNNDSDVWAIADRFLFENKRGGWMSNDKSSQAGNTRWASNPRAIRNTQNRRNSIGTDVAFPEGTATFRLQNGCYQTCPVSFLKFTGLIF
jgi:hypothetical protein